MNGTQTSNVIVTLCNPLDLTDTLQYIIVPADNALAHDWVIALKDMLQNKNLLEKNFCFLGFPKSPRTLEYLCDELNVAVTQINTFNLSDVWQNAGLKSYLIDDWYHPDTVRFPDTYPVTVRGRPDIEIGLAPKQQVLNRLHNYFEQLQGTVWEPSQYYKLANYTTKYAIRQLNTICHELESLLLSQRKLRVLPEWVRPSQITTFLHATRYPLNDEHKELFMQTGYDRKFGHVYMHWSQIGKTLFEVWRDEHAPKLTIGDDPCEITTGAGTTCEAINALKVYSGEFDIEWGKDVVYDNAQCPWHVTEIDAFYAWLKENNIDTTNKNLSLGYLPLGAVDLQTSFGTTDLFKIWDMLSKYLNIVKIEVDGVSNTFDYCWSDVDYKQQQINMLKPGYDFSSRG